MGHLHVSSFFKEGRGKGGADLLSKGLIDLPVALDSGEPGEVGEPNAAVGFRLFAIDFDKSGVVIHPLPQSSAACKMEECRARHSALGGQGRQGWRRARIRSHVPRWERVTLLTG